MEPTDDQIRAAAFNAIHNFKPMEEPYSDTGCVKKGWDFRYFKDDGGPFFEFKPSFLVHSKNWSMGTLNIDIFAIEFSFWRWEWFLAYRIVVKPPKAAV